MTRFGRRDCTAAVLLLLLSASCKHPELADAPPTPVRRSEAKTFLDHQVAVLSERKATDCGEMLTAIKPALDCAEHALNDNHAFYLRVRGGTEGVMYGDAQGNVTMFSYQAVVFYGSWCPMGGPRRIPTIPPPVRIRQHPLMIAGNPVGRPPFTFPPRVLTRVPIAKSSAPYLVHHTGAYAQVAVDATGAVTRCMATGPWFAKKQICDSVSRWSFIPATFLGRPVAYSRHILMFEIDGDQITERDPRRRRGIPV